MTEAFFDFEKPIANLERKLQDLRDLAKQEGVDFSHEIEILEKRVSSLIDETYAKLTPWQKVQLSRHPTRPYTRDYIDQLFPDFAELHGDRAFGDDQAIVAGVASWPPVKPGEGSQPSKDSTSIMIFGNQKGRTTKQKMERNFGMARPEGYRKAIRLMQLAERAKMPIITLIDTPGAYPGLDAEERGQSAAIAESIEEMFRLTVPVVALVIGEGGSGGALAIGIANRVLMQEYSTYSVISPESCASILWSDSSLAERASDRLKMNPPDLLKMGIIDKIVREPKGGAHRDPAAAAELVRAALVDAMTPMLKGFAAASNGSAKASKAKKATPAKVPLDLRAERIAKFRKMGEMALGHAPIAPGA